jgi:hypothetical protein
MRSIFEIYGTRFLNTRESSQLANEKSKRIGYSGRNLDVNYTTLTLTIRAEKLLEGNKAEISMANSNCIRAKPSQGL